MLHQLKAFIFTFKLNPKDNLKFKKCINLNNGVGPGKFCPNGDRGVVVGKY